MMEKYGVKNLNEHYTVMDTICDATQERQDAMYKLVDAKPDIMLVIGGFNSSNTQHLQEISEDYKIPSFWVDTPGRLTDENTILHRLAHGELVETKAGAQQTLHDLGFWAWASGRVAWGVGFRIREL